MAPAERVQVLLQPDEKLRMQQLAEREGVSLSSWMRQVALDRLAEVTLKKRFTTSADLHEFFEHCRELEPGREPDWDIQREIIEQSKRAGATST